MMKWQQQYEQRQKELYLQLQQQHKNLQSPIMSLDLQSSLTTSSSSQKPTTMITSPDSSYDIANSDKQAVLVNDVAATKPQFTPSSNNKNNNTPLTTSSSSPKPATMTSSPDSTYDIGSGREAVVVDDVAVTQSTSLSSSSDNDNNNSTLKTPPKKKSRKNNMKPKDTRRHTSISFDEMCRLMRVYGSLKCLRNRTTKTTTKDNVDECSSIKIDSTKRKFYRWFPDLDERFVRNLETGCYEPKAGHVNEMAYRESMRMSDQNKLVMKRLNGRSKVHVK